MLLVEVDGSERLRWLCQTCPYVNYPSTARRIAMPLKAKQVDDVLGGDEAWANVDQTDLRCEDCGHDRAYYIQMQTRSADEPMTVFYKVRAPPEHKDGFATAFSVLACRLWPRHEDDFATAFAVLACRR